ncbi:MAG: hypothetical protein MJY78_03570 [Fibrobacter sp.]|nr:hypothetical protein [Fibrobacter sp.]
MIFPISHRISFAVLALLLAAPLMLHAEEQSTWDKFVNWFKPSPSIEGEGPLYDELKALEEKIDQTEARYSRERRPGNKARFKKEMENLRKQRDELVKKIEAEEKAKKDADKKATNSPVSSSSAIIESSSAATLASSASTKADSAASVPACKPDTVFVRDTVLVHDTLYVIVADKPKADAPSTDSAKAGATATDSTKVNPD